MEGGTRSGCCITNLEMIGVLSKNKAGAEVSFLLGSDGILQAKSAIKKLVQPTPRLNLLVNSFINRLVQAEVGIRPPHPACLHSP